MKTFYKHIVIHGDIIIDAKDVKEAQRVYEETQLLIDHDNIRWDGELVDEETTDWIELKD